MRINRIIMVIVGCLAFFSLPASAETPLLEELMRKYTFPLIFLSLLGGVLTVGYLYVTGLLPKVIFESWKWVDERFALHRYVSLATQDIFYLGMNLGLLRVQLASKWPHLYQEWGH